MDRSLRLLQAVALSGLAALSLACRAPGWPRSFALEPAWPGPVRDRAAEALALEAAPADLPLLRRLRESPRPRLRAAAGRGLFRVLGEGGLGELTKLLDDPDPRVRHALYLALAQAPGPNAAPFLRAGLRDHSDEVVADCVNGLLALRDRDALPDLMGYIRRRPEGRRTSWTEAEAEVGNAAASLAGLELHFQAGPAPAWGNDPNVSARRALMDWWQKKGLPVFAAKTGNPFLR